MSSPLLFADGRSDVGPITIKSAPDASIRSVLLINTGGTISMRANETGALEPSPG
jgi:L-asparaginase/Glu-tRNA(Gln) amidotransferase subunit D